MSKWDYFSIYLSVRPTVVRLRVSKYLKRSVQLNHPELMWKNSTHLAISVMMWFEKVRGGSMRLNHPELVHKHPANLVSADISSTFLNKEMFKKHELSARGFCT